MDITKKPNLFEKYKIQPSAHKPYDIRRVLKASCNVLSNQFFVGIPFSNFLYLLSKIVGVTPGLKAVPTFPKLMFDLIVMGCVYEIGFFYSHLLMHHPLLYKRIHKIHHEWTAPVSVMANYAHWFGLSITEKFKNQLLTLNLF